MKNIFYLIFFVLCFVSCDSLADKNKHADTVKLNDTAFSERKWPSVIPKKDKINSENKSGYDSLISLKIDTNNFEGKRQEINRQFILDNAPAQPDSDTLIDLNFDGCPDYMIRYHGLAGTGLKNKIAVYLYHKKQDAYVKDSLLSSLTNPSFYLKEKKITAFYIGLGGGSGNRYEWINEKWTITMNFLVTNKEGECRWYCFHYFNGKRAIAKSFGNFRMIPPPEILETNVR